MGAEADRRQPAAPDRPLDAGERGRHLRPLRLLRRPLVRPELGALHPVHDVQDRDRLAQGQARRRAHRQLGRPVERRRRGQDVRARRPRRGARHGRALLGLPLNTADEDDLDAIVDELHSLRPHLRGFSSDDYNNLLAGDAWMHQTWSGDMAALLWQADDPSIFGFESPERGTPGQLRRLRDPGATPSTPGTALLFIDYMLRPENVEKNINYIGYPMPVHGTEDVYEAIVEALPECQVTSEDLEHGPLLRQRQRRRRPGPRRGLHRDQGRLMTTTHRPSPPGPHVAHATAVDLAAGARHALDVAVLRLRPGAGGRAELRHHRRAGQPALRHHAGQHPRRLRRRPTCA